MQQVRKLVYFTECKEYRTIYKGPDFLEVALLGFTPTPSPSPVSKLDCMGHTGRLRKRVNLLTGGVRKGVGVEPNHTTPRKPGLCKSFNPP
jgi:hypothetical protein